MAQSPPTNEAVATPAASEPSSFEAAHNSVLADKTIQFEHITNKVIPRKEPPKWLEGLAEFVRDISPFIGYLFWIALAILLLIFAYFIITEVMGIRFFQPKMTQEKEPPAPTWQPNATEARNLLAAADALAAEGQFEEAVHLILLRSIEDIDRFRPLVVRPALTTRDIAAIEALPDRARPAFMRIATAVERSLFGGGRVDRDEFGLCREAYAAFALPTEWRA
jgi:hypothetical protein